MRKARLLLVAAALLVAGCTAPEPSLVPNCGEGSTVAPDGSIHCVQVIFPPP